MEEQPMQPNQPAQPGQMPSQPPMQQTPPPMQSAPQQQWMPKRSNKNALYVGIAVIAVLITAAVAVGNAKNVDIFSSLGLGMSKEAVAKNAIDYINANNLAGPGQTAVAQAVSEESGLVKIKVQIGANTFDSYATKDGKLLFPTAIQLTPTTGTGSTPTPNPTAQAVDIAKVKIDGEPFTGNVNAPVVMAFWSDYQCPFCKQVEQQVIPQVIKDYVNTGKVKIVFKDYPFLGADSQTLARFARAVWETDPAKFYVWNKAMYDNQGQENTGWATQDKIMSITTTAIGASDANKALALFKKNGDAYQALMDADKAEGTSFGITGTPGTIIGKTLISGADSYDNFKKAIDAQLAATK